MSLVGTKIVLPMRTALITGIAGQDGSYLAEFLLSKGYEVHGLIRPYSGKPELVLHRILHILSKINLHVGDIADEGVVRERVGSISPDEIYHLATTHEVSITTENYLLSRSVNIDSTEYFLSAIHELQPKCRFFYASSSNVFGRVTTAPQNEETNLSPDSLYSISKVAGMHLVRLHRTQRGLFACSGMLFNHESPRRDLFFLPRKIASAAARIKLGLAKEFELGELDARKDWGYAGDFVEAMWLSLQAETPDDYVIGTGETHAVRDILDAAFGLLELDWKQYVKVNPRLVRPREGTEMVADISKIKNKLGWTPKTGFKELIKMMVEEDLRLNRS